MISYLQERLDWIIGFLNYDHFFPVLSLFKYV